MIDSVFKNRLTTLLEVSIGTKLYHNVNMLVSKHYRSMNLVASELVAQGVLLNLLLNSRVSPNSADEIFTFLRSLHKSFRTTIENAFLPVERDFYDYAKTVLNDKYNAALSYGMDKPQFIVYVLSYDLATKCKINRAEILSMAKSYDELKDLTFPYYK